MCPHSYIKTCRNTAAGNFKVSPFLQCCRVCLMMNLQDTKLNHIHTLSMCPGSIQASHALKFPSDGFFFGDSCKKNIFPTSNTYSSDSQKRTQTPAGLRLLACFTRNWSNTHPPVGLIKCLWKVWQQLQLRVFVLSLYKLLTSGFGQFISVFLTDPLKLHQTGRESPVKPEEPSYLLTCAVPPSPLRRSWSHKTTSGHIIID